MKTFARQMVGAVALLCSSAGMAATIEVRPSTGVTSGCCTAEVLAGTSFSVTVHGDGFGLTAGATLGLTWDNSVVNVTNVTAAAGTPFTGGVVAAAPWNPISILGPLTGTLPSGSFDTFVIAFNAIAPGAANIQLVDDQSDLCWSDGTPGTFGCITGVSYTQANVSVSAIPAPAAAWLIAPAVLAAGRFSRRRKAA